jgi:hypothetical protein
VTARTDWARALLDPADTTVRRAFVDWCTEAELRRFDVGEPLYAIIHHPYYWLQVRTFWFVSIGTRFIAVANPAIPRVLEVNFVPVWAAFSDESAAHRLKDALVAAADGDRDKLQHLICYPRSP